MTVALNQIEHFFSEWRKISSQVIEKKAAPEVDYQEITAKLNVFFTIFNQTYQPIAPIAVDEQLAQLAHFIDEWKKIPAFIEPPKVSLESKIDLSEATNFFVQLTETYTKYYQEGHAINVWDICGIKYDEVKHCQILKWLLDPHGTHGFGHHFLALLINNHIPELCETFDFNQSYSIKTEVCYACDDENPDSRIDILIENKTHLLILEVKINATETNNQMMRYCNIAKNSGKEWKLLYLTRQGTKPQKQGETDNEEEFKEMQNQVICLRWQEIEKLIKSFIADENPPTFINPFTQQLLLQYSHYIKQHFK